MDTNENIYIVNNILECRQTYNGSNWEDYAITMWANRFNMDIISNVNILRNTIIFVCDSYYNHDAVNVYNSTIQDNIIINLNSPSKVIDFATDHGNIIRKNVLSMDGEELGNAEIIANFPDNHFVGATEAGTFTCTQSTYRSEQYFQLKDGSPAKNAAYDGGDCGAFGGSTPYIICGRPQGIPYITDVEVPAQPTNNQLTVTFKVANQNE